MFKWASIVILGASGVAFAQYTGPSSTDNTNNTGAHTSSDIQAILDDPDDGEDVVLEGFLVRKIDDDYFPAGEVSETTRVRIEGEVDTHRLRETDIEVDRVTILE